MKISNSSEDHSLVERFGLEPSEPILPDILGQTELLTPDIVKNVSVSFIDDVTFFFLFLLGFIHR